MAAVAAEVIFWVAFYGRVAAEENFWIAFYDPLFRLLDIKELGFVLVPDLRITPAPGPGPLNFLTPV